MGIYLIECAPTKKIYVGSSVDIGHRLTDHFSALRNKKHTNKYLQRAWNKHGKIRFDFKILQTVFNLENLRIIEEDWIKNLKSDDPKIGFNLTNNCVRPHNLGKKASPELRLRLSKMRKGRISQQILDYNRLKRVEVVGFKDNAEIIKFESIKAAMRAGYGNITRCILHPNMTCGGLHWKKIEKC